MIDEYIVIGRAWGKPKGMEGPDHYWIPAGTIWKSACGAHTLDAMDTFSGIRTTSPLKITRSDRICVSSARACIWKPITAGGTALSLPQSENDLEEPMSKFDEALPPIIEVDNDNPQSDDNSGCWTVIMFAVIMIALGYGGVKLAPKIDEFVSEKIEAGARSTQEAKDNPDQWCRDNGYVKNGNITDEIEQINAEACLPYCGEPSAEECNQLYDMTYILPHDQGEWNEYIRWADATSNDMYKVVSRIELLAELYYEGTDQSVSSGDRWLDDQEVSKIVKGIKEDVLNIQDQAMSVWPPAPYDSSNPLLDSHARIVNASSELIRAGYWLVLFEDFPANERMARMNNSALDALNELDRAQIGLDIARGME